MTTPSNEKQMVNFTIDGRSVSVPKGTTVYNAATKLGIYIPIFCYQDRMPPFGACRVCLVEVEKMAKPQTACTLEATEGMVVKTQSSTAVEARAAILEFLLINHPLDCPICDRGGECPLQEHAMAAGPGKSRFYENKRHFKKPVPRGPVLMLDRERCIICARCTRFGDLVAGDNALEFIERGYRTEVGTPDGGPAKSKFIGNTIMICPVGALTSQVYRFRARPWDNEPTPSTCTLCPVGCSFIIDSRDGQIMRTRSQENRAVNDIWLCDKGWFGYEFCANTNRLQKPLIRKSGKLVEAEWDEALSLVASKFISAKRNGKIAAFGGNPLTVEENYLFQKLIRNGAGVNNIDHRIGMPIFGLDEEGMAPGMDMSIGEVEQLSFAVLLGLDLTEEFPVIWLRLKQAMNCGAKVIFIGHYAPEMAAHLDEAIVLAPGKSIKEYLPKISALATNGAQGAIFIGRQYLASPQRTEILSELSSLNIKINIMEGRGNSTGARFSGMRPDLAALGSNIDKPGLNAIEVLQTAAQSGWDFLYVVGANPVKKYPSKLWSQARAKTGFLVVQDLFMNETAEQADVILPTLSYVEKGGSFINIEGRIQKLLPGKMVPENIYSDAEIFTHLAKKIEIPLDFDLKFAQAMMGERVGIQNTEYRILKGSERIQNSESRIQNGLKASFAPALFDNGVRMKHDPHVIQLAREPKVRIHPNEGIKRGIANDDQITITSNGSKISAQVKLDNGVAEETIVIPIGFDSLPAYELGANLLNGLEVQIAKQ